MNYYEIVFSVLERWYERFAQATPKIILGVLVFTLILLFSSYPVSYTHLDVDKRQHYSIVYVLGLIVIAPIVEELFFRRFIFVKLLEKHSFWMSITVSSLSLIHI